MRNIVNTCKYKWNITFKICESLYCTPVTCNIVYQLYFNFKKFKNEYQDLSRLFFYSRKASVKFLPVM